MEDKCPGHEGICQFCKAEKGTFEYVGGSFRVDRRGNKIRTYCCNACKTNAAYNKKFDPDVAARINH